MIKDPERTEAKRAEIAAAALELFFEHGYDGTSIRMIQRKVGKEAGLFYYYFDSKDAVFEAAIDLFFVSYEKPMQEIVANGKEDPDHELTKFIDHIDRATQEFRAQYLQKLHWSVLSAIREHTMRIMKKYIRQILDNYLEKGLLRETDLPIEVATNLLAFGIGGSILYQSGAEYHAQRAGLKSLIERMPGVKEKL